MRHIRRQCQGCLVVLCILLVTSATISCATPRLPTPTITPTASAEIPSATSAPLPVLPQLSLPPAGAVVASPDGTRIAALDLSLSTLTLYNLAGAVYGHYRDPAGIRLGVSWLADSSGVFISGGDMPLQLMDRSGTVHATAMNAVSGPLLAPDGQWIAATHVASVPAQDQVEIAPRSGAPVQRLAMGSDFLGWLDDEIAYIANGTVFLLPPGAGSARAIAQVSAGDTLREVTAAAVVEASSPDDQALIVQGKAYNYWLLSDTGLVQLPKYVTQGSISVQPIFWAGPHTALGTSGTQAAVKVIDVLTGATRNTSATLSGDSPQAVSGNWIAATTLARPIELFAINYQTGAAHDLGELPLATTVLPLGLHGQFLVRDADGVTYVANTA